MAADSWERNYCSSSSCNLRHASYYEFTMWTWTYRYTVVVCAKLPRTPRCECGVGVSFLKLKVPFMFHTPGRHKTHSCTDAIHHAPHPPQARTSRSRFHACCPRLLASFIIGAPHSTGHPFAICLCPHRCAQARQQHSLSGLDAIGHPLDRKALDRCRHHGHRLGLGPRTEHAA